RRAGKRLDVVPAARDDPLTGPGRGRLDPRPSHPHDLVPRRRDQLHRHDAQHACVRDDVDAHPALRVGNRDVRVAARARPPGAVGGADDADPRPAGRHPLLRARRRREPDPLPARLLVLRAPGGLHHDPAGDGDDLGDHSRLLAQADLRLHRDRLVDGGDRLLLDARLGPPHVRGRPADGPRLVLHDQLDDHRRADRREDLQLAGDALARQHLVRHPDAVGGRLHRRLHDRRAVRDLPRGLPDRLGRDGLVLRRRPPPLRRLRRLDLRDLRGDLLLVAEDLRPGARRAAREAPVLARLRRLQRHLLPPALPRVARDAAARLHVRSPRPLGGLQHGVHDRFLRDGSGHAGVRRERREDDADGAPRGERPVARGHARVVHDLAAAALELRADPVRHERAAAARPAPPTRRGGPAVIAGPWARLLAAGAVAGTGLAVVSGAAGWGTAHRVLAAVALPWLAGLLVLAWVSARHLLAPAFAAVVLFGLAALLTARDVHLAAATLAFGAAAVVATRVVRGGRSGGHVDVRDYVTLTKPRVMSLLLLTGGAAVFVGAHGVPGWDLFALAIAGLALACGGAAALNHYLDRDIDPLMGERTARRPVASGRVAPELALEFGIALSAASFVLLDALVNLPTALLALGGNLFYVLVYTRWLKRTTPQNIVVGGAAGAVPPLVGYAGASGRLGWAALVMFLVVFLWTPPHFWALALLIREQYAKAHVPMLPVVRGDRETARQIAWYTVALVAATLVPVALGVFDLVYGVAALVLGAAFAWTALRLLRETTRARAALVFHSSLAYLALLFVAMALDAAV